MPAPIQREHERRAATPMSQPSTPPASASAAMPSLGIGCAPNDVAAAPTIGDEQDAEPDADARVVVDGARMPEQPGGEQHHDDRQRERDASEAARRTSRRSRVCAIVLSMRNHSTTAPAIASRTRKNGTPSRRSSFASFSGPSARNGAADACARAPSRRARGRAGFGSADGYFTVFWRGRASRPACAPSNRRARACSRAREVALVLVAMPTRYFAPPSLAREERGGCRPVRGRAGASADGRDHRVATDSRDSMVTKPSLTIERLGEVRSLDAQAEPANALRRAPGRVIAVQQRAPDALRAPLRIARRAISSGTPDADEPVARVRSAGTSGTSTRRSGCRARRSRRTRSRRAAASRRCTGETLGSSRTWPPAGAHALTLQFAASTSMSPRNARVGRRRAADLEPCHSGSVLAQCFRRISYARCAASASRLRLDDERHDHRAAAVAAC